MSRQVDVKALVSHIVRGDGADKCRICMGDTTEGQVYLGDTVMMDGERPVTLSELLEIVTGVEVPLEEELPPGLCSICSSSAMAAASFRSTCLQATEHWNSVLRLLHYLPTEDDIYHKKSIYAIVANNNITIIDHDIKDIAYSPKTDITELSLDEQLRRRKIIKTQKIARQHCHCHNCGKKFVCARDLSRHLMESTDLQRACYICASTMPRNDLVTHLKQIHNCVPYDCKKCPALFETPDQFNLHLKKAHAPGAHSCGDCGCTFQTLHAFHGHLSAHSAKNCPGCDKLFRNNRCYLHHLMKCCNLDLSHKDTLKTKLTFEVKSNKTERRIKVGARGSSSQECFCDYCGKMFAGKKFVCAHIQIVHMKNTHRPCPYCGKLLAAAHMTTHIKQHEEIKMFNCEHCGVVLKSKLGYVQHLRLHTGEKPYTCKHCLETFSASSRRSEHIRKIHKKEQNIPRHACELCTAKFRLPYRLKKHISVVHGDNKMSFECPECHMKVRSVRALVQHTNKHHISQFNPLKQNRKGMVLDAPLTAEES